MKKTANLSVYKLLGYLLLGIGAYAVLNANTVKTQAIAVGEPIQTSPTNSSRSRHKITLVLNNLSDLKVEEGQRINVGDVISDKPTAWLRYALPNAPNYKPKSRGYQPHYPAPNYPCSN